MIMIGKLALSNPSGLIRYVYITLRGIVYAVELLGKQYHHLYKPTVFCSISEPSFFPIAAIFGEKACRHVNVCPGIMIFNKSYIVLNKY